MQAESSVHLLLFEERIFNHFEGFWCAFSAFYSVGASKDIGNLGQILSFETGFVPGGTDR